MGSVMKKSGSLLLLGSLALVFFSCSESGTGPNVPQISFSAQFAPWPGKAIAAYSLIADDYCGGLRGQTHADTMMANRGMGMAFGAMVASCQSSDWMDAQAKMARGHEIVNHSWDHPCFTDVEECGSGPVVGPHDFDLQLAQSGNRIGERTGRYPTFFVFPYDCATDEALNYLRQLGYLGVRMGAKQQLNENQFDPFRLNFDVNWPVGQKEGFQRWTLNEMVDAVLEQGQGWAIREIHGVDDGWGPVTYAEMREHADYLQQKVAEGSLWVAPPSRVIQYHNQRNHYTLHTLVRSDTLQTEGVEMLQGVYVVEFLGGPLSETYNTPLTLVVKDLPQEGVLGWRAKQTTGEEVILPAEEELRIEVFPSRGELALIAIM